MLSNHNLFGSADDSSLKDLKAFEISERSLDIILKMDRTSLIFCDISIYLSNHITSFERQKRGLGGKMISCLDNPAFFGDEHVPFWEVLQRKPILCVYLWIFYCSSNSLFQSELATETI
jgi:hypothetical protein